MSESNNNESSAATSATAPVEMSTVHRMQNSVAHSAQQRVAQPQIPQLTEEQRMARIQFNDIASITLANVLECLDTDPNKSSRPFAHVDPKYYENGNVLPPPPDIVYNSVYAYGSQFMDVQMLGRCIAIKALNSQQDAIVNYVNNTIYKNQDSRIKFINRVRRGILIAQLLTEKIPIDDGETAEDYVNRIIADGEDTDEDSVSQAEEELQPKQAKQTKETKESKAPKPAPKAPKKPVEEDESEDELADVDEDDEDQEESSEEVKPKSKKHTTAPSKSSKSKKR